MFKFVFLTALTLAIAIGGGAGSVWLLMDTDAGFGTINVGNWTAFPKMGTNDADPYSKARFAREADLALGQAEGIAFTARRDSGGQLLRADCAYSVEGTFPAARFWTLYAQDLDHKPLPAAGGRAPALHSTGLLRAQDGKVRISVSRRPSPGNWLAISGTEPFILALTLYDTATASNSHVSDIELPRITRTSCNG
ncbi:DUF1214 domain-containing protein [Aquamicrobium sp. LC103]|uniref:DUF1214 domain-containing protein n=1 Tax=Aquamicrobium sp. LC103 TaxID=1120658 RepID=UPI00063ECFC6|nr:DUF1214 domain-containing protein [Aquamicrobium sp. LC103]TKT81219.1 DUF1214 domain-containing protein [Aquamicrobium sp. LC103]